GAAPRGRRTRARGRAAESSCGEGGIRTREPFGYPLSKRAHSATMRPLQRRDYRAYGARRDRHELSAAPGGEGGIRTREAFAYRFSRAAPSTTRTPLHAQV